VSGHIFFRILEKCALTPFDHVAELTGIAERTLFRRLSANGLTYAGLIDELRFSEAKKLLQTPGMRIEDVAISVGFDDHSNFTRMFHRIAGVTPREFRKAAVR